ncbi:DUF2507 domain-containing protein [Shouchella lonarensis]|uniref:DUF2507 domain-containing protein n=1 Tax=Shouchella lonarensis TaxID=1464122 RepID=A0A1G6K2T3_9BACI|nr:DUF2507 domain-containing protein [Shouchella lonarensis]SDC25243.1 Protein of unknown function [Shouchella lonarensis]
MNNVEEQQFAYNLIRNDVLRHILGKEHDALLYWTGKALARTHSLPSQEALPDFFRQAQWGTLQLIKQKRNEYTYLLEGEWMGKDDTRCYQLEAGFLAEQFERWLEHTVIVHCTIKKKSTMFTVHIDKSETLLID